MAGGQYYIHVIDTQDDTHVSVLEDSAKDTLTLSWEGSDLKDNKTIIGSSLEFSFIDKTSTDGFFSDLYTYDENRFLVKFFEAEGDTVLWQGHLLSDQYSEALTRPNRQVDFTSTCGLARLKGLEFPEEFYGTERSIMELFTQAFKAIDLTLDIYIKTGIENNLEKNWNAIYIPIEDKDDRDDMYQIIEDILSDLLSVIYQCDNRWYVEGWNWRNSIQVPFDKYIYDSEEDLYTGAQTVILTKTLKTIDCHEALAKAFASPTVSIIQPYKRITVNAEFEPIEIPEVTYKEINAGWTTGFNASQNILATEWYGADFTAYGYDPDYYIRFNGSNSALDKTKRVTNLNGKLFIEKGKKYRLQAEFRLVTTSELSSSQKESLINADLWINPMLYEIRYGFTTSGTVLLAQNDSTVRNVTIKEALIFNESLEASLYFEFTATLAGTLQTAIIQPFGDKSVNKIDAVELRNFEIEEIGFEEEVIYENVIAEDYSEIAERDLNYVDDKTGTTIGYRFTKLDSKVSNGEVRDVTAIHSFQQNGKNYLQFTLFDANLIDENRSAVLFSGSPVTINDVIYNYGDGEMMVVETEAVWPDSTVFQIDRLYPENMVETQTIRDHWTQWTDSFYSIEKDRLGDAISKVYRRMFRTKFSSIDVDVNVPVKFNDVVKFDYIEQKNYMVTNCSIAIDDSLSSIVVNEMIYNDDGTGLFPPVVTTDGSYYMAEIDDQLFAKSYAYDPDGYIVSFLWTEISSDGDLFIFQPNNQNTVIGFNGNNAVVQVEVTDNDGLTDTATLNIYRSVDYDLSFDTHSSGTITNGVFELFHINLTPTLEQNAILILKGTATTIFDFVDIDIESGGLLTVNLSSRITITKNGNTLYDFIEIRNDFEVENGEAEIVNHYPVNFSYIMSDDVQVYLEAIVEIINSAQSDGTIISYSSLHIDEYEFTQGAHTIDNLPVSKTINKQVMF